MKTHREKIKKKHINFGYEFCTKFDLYAGILLFHILSYKLISEGQSFT